MSTTLTKPPKHTFAHQYTERYRRDHDPTWVVHQVRDLLSKNFRDFALEEYRLNKVEQSIYQTLEDAAQKAVEDRKRQIEARAKEEAEEAARLQALYDRGVREIWIEGEASLRSAFSVARDDVRRYGTDWYGDEVQSHLEDLQEVPGVKNAEPDGGGRSGEWEETDITICLENPEFRLLVPFNGSVPTEKEVEPYVLEHFKEVIARLHALEDVECLSVWSDHYIAD